MEAANFFKLLYKHRLGLIAVPLIAVIITFFLVRNLPNQYASHSRIATGLVDQTQQTLDNKGELQESKINQDFSNLIQMLQLKKMLDQVSYLLIIHDLAGDSAFHKPSKQFNDLNKDARKHAVEVYTKLYQNRQPLSLWNKDENGLNQVLVSMGYDDKSLNKKVSVYRVGASDFIDIEVESESPELSAFIANTLCKEFITYYTFVIKENQLKAVTFLEKLLKEKRDSVNNKMQELKTYKIGNRVLNLNEQAKSLYGQIADFETRIEIAQKDIIATTGALNAIDAKFNPKDREYLESAMVRINQNILATKVYLQQAMDDYVKSNYDVHYKGKIDSLKNALTLQINQSTDKYILDPLAAKESLVQQKINLEVTLDLAKNSIASLKQEIDRLNKKFDGLVPHEAVIQAFESDIDVASKEYLEVLARFNQTSMESGFSIQLKQIEDAQPGTVQPSKKMVLVLMAGMVSLIFYMVILFILFYLDDTIKVSKELADKTNIPVLGFLPFIKTAIPDMEDLWHNEQDSLILQEYKNLLRSIRFETDREMNGTKSLVVTSMKPGEGKTLFILSLAYAYAKTNKKVLVIDGNPDNPVISKMRTPAFFLEDYFSGLLSAGQLHHESNISLLANRGGDTTLFELNNEPVIRQRLQLLYETFDVVLIETSSLDSLNKSKEWITVTDKVVAVFEVNQGISAAKQVQVDYLKNLGTRFIGWVLNKVVDEKIQKERKKRKGTNTVVQGLS